MILEFTLIILQIRKAKKTLANSGLRANFQMRQTHSPKKGKGKGFLTAVTNTAHSDADD